MFALKLLSDLFKDYLSSLPRAKGFEELTGDGGTENRLMARRMTCREKSRKSRDQCPAASQTAKFNRLYLCGDCEKVV
jgi:hypothetical protein